MSERRSTLSWGCVKLPGVFRPFEAGERRSSLCNLTLQSFPFCRARSLSHDYSLFLGTEPHMLVSQLTSRLASGISKLVRNFRRRMDILHYSCSHFGLKISKSEDCARKVNTHSIWSATYSTARRPGTSPCCPASWGSRTIGKGLGIWAVLARLPER